MIKFGFDFLYYYPSKFTSMAGADQKLNKYCTLCREVCIVRTSHTLSKYTKTTLQIDPSSISPSPDNARQKVLLKALLCFHREKKLIFPLYFNSSAYTQNMAWMMYSHMVVCTEYETCTSSVSK